MSDLVAAIESSSTLSFCLLRNRELVLAFCSSARSSSSSNSRRPLSCVYCRVELRVSHEKSVTTEANDVACMHITVVRLTLLGFASMMANHVSDVDDQFRQRTARSRQGRTRIAASIPIR